MRGWKRRQAVHYHSTKQLAMETCFGIVYLSTEVWEQILEVQAIVLISIAVGHVLVRMLNLEAGASLDGMISPHLSAHSHKRS